MLPQVLQKISSSAKKGSCLSHLSLYRKSAFSLRDPVTEMCESLDKFGLVTAMPSSETLLLPPHTFSTLT